MGIFDFLFNRNKSNNKGKEKLSQAQNNQQSLTEDEVNEILEKEIETFFPEEGNWKSCLLPLTQIRYSYRIKIFPT